MGRTGPKSFAQRGLTRNLVPDVPRLLVEMVYAAVQDVASSAISRSARDTIDRVGEIYKRRGFQGLSEDELSVSMKDDRKLHLEYVDTLKGARDWKDAGFTVSVTTGNWHIVVSNGKVPKIEAAYPVVEGTRRSSPPRPAASLERKLNLSHIKKDGDEWTRLAQLGDALQYAQRSLHSFVESRCPQSMRSRIRSACSQLQAVCNSDIPGLAVEINWDGTEDWQCWATRLLAQVSVACFVEDSLVHVSDMHFTHASISKVFRQGMAAGSDLETLVEDLRLGHANPLLHDDLVLESVRYKGKLYSLNNRRLWALQQHQLMLLSEGASVQVRIRILPWALKTTLTRFSNAFDSDLGGETVRCRTTQDGAPTDGVVGTTLARAVLATGAAEAAESAREQSMLKQHQASKDEDSKVEWNSVEPVRHSLSLGAETFVDWKDAKVRVQQIMKKRSGGTPVSVAEFNLLQDLFRCHPNAKGKRIDEVTAVTVGSSEKFIGTPAFWIWRKDGSGEDISVHKCWKRIDLASKKTAKYRDVIEDGARYSGKLVEWCYAKDKNYGYIALDAPAPLGQQLSVGQQLYVQWNDLSPATRARSNSSLAWPFPKGTSFTFAIYRWKDNGKSGCTEVLLAEGVGSA